MIGEFFRLLETIAGRSKLGPAERMRPTEEFQTLVVYKKNILKVGRYSRILEAIPVSAQLENQHQAGKF